MSDDEIRKFADDVKAQILTLTTILQGGTSSPVKQQIALSPTLSSTDLATSEGGVFVIGALRSKLESALLADRQDINQHRPGSWDVADVMAVVDEWLKDAGMRSQ